MSKALYIEGVTNKEYCYWCGEKLKEHQEWDEYICYRSYMCDCADAKQEDSLLHRIELLNDQLARMKQKQGAVDRKYNLELDALNRKYSR